MICLFVTLVAVVYLYRILGGNIALQSKQSKRGPCSKERTPGGGGQEQRQERLAREDAVALCSILSSDQFQCVKDFTEKGGLCSFGKLARPCFVNVSVCRQS